MTADHARRDAVRAVARVLHGRLIATLDADHVAGLVLDALHEHGWRHVPRPPEITGDGRRDPDTAHRGAARVRQALARTEGDQP